MSKSAQTQEAPKIVMSGLESLAMDALRKVLEDSFNPHRIYFRQLKLWSNWEDCNSKRIAIVALFTSPDLELMSRAGVISKRHSEVRAVLRFNRKPQTSVWTIQSVLYTISHPQGEMQMVDNPSVSVEMSQELRDFCEVLSNSGLGQAA